MKICEIQLIAYGPFTNVRLDLDGGDPGLHILYGPNEAGKSSALRALRSLLYGIPERSPDDFLHSYKKMRVGGTLQRKNGEVLELVRRKGRSNTLRSADDKTALDESLIRECLNGMEEDHFSATFGIDHNELVRGGKEIVAGGGSMGQILFAAGSGIPDLHQVQRDLQDEADRLFRPSGHKPRINEALGRLMKNRKALREAQLPGQEWVKHDRALQKAQEHVRTISGNLKEKQRDRHRLERIREALPIIARRKELMEEYKEYATALLLPENFKEERHRLITTLGIEEKKHSQIVEGIEALKGEIAKLDIPYGLLENSDEIEEIHQELGSHRKAAKDRIRLETLRNVLRSEAYDLLRGLREDSTLEEAERLRIRKADRVGIKELGGRYERIIMRRDHADEAIPKISDQIKALDEKLKLLDRPKSIDPLKIAIEQAEEYGVLEKKCSEDREEVGEELDKLASDLRAQSLWAGTIGELEGLSIPSFETIDEFEARIDRAGHRVVGLRSEIDEVAAAHIEIERQLEQLQLEQDVPTEDDLLALRGLRGQGWGLVRGTLEGERPSEEEAQAFIRRFQPADDLLDAFEESMRQTDEIADRLRREADRVANLARLIAEKAASEKRSKGLEEDLNAAERALSDVHHEWAGLWQPYGVRPRTPKEMRGWARDHCALRERAVEMRERTSRVDRLQERIDTHREVLEECLDSLSELPSVMDRSLANLVKRARWVVDHQEILARKRQALETEKTLKVKELDEVKDRVEECEEELSQWLTEWEPAIRPLGLQRASTPSQANAVMEDLSDLFEKLKEADTLYKRIKGIDRDAEAFAARVTNLVRTAAGDLKGMAVEQAANELNTRLKRARTNHTKLKTLEAQLDQEGKREKEVEEEIATAEARLTGMCEEAGCEGYDSLPEIEERSEKRRTIESEIKNIDEQLLKLSAGNTIEDFVTEASKEDPDGIDMEIQRLAEQIDALSHEKSDQDQTIGSERTELSKMDGSAGAAEIAEETQMILGRLENDIEQYARLRIASAVLRQAIERYREKNQGPILKRAGTLFAKLTDNSFAGVRADYGPQGGPVLVGVRPGSGEIVHVEGMSEGTADQLYLALRLAGIEEYLERNEPMPFVVDDILIKFDDDRAAAALKVLEQIASKTQVIFFTHHRHLVELAEEIVDPSILITHSL